MSEPQLLPLRRQADRRRFADSMIRNYLEYSGPERRSGADRRARGRVNTGRGVSPIIEALPRGFDN
ncbi:MAG: hypothetical protein AAF384_09490 [Pseudomonadota bacterium]